jgi:predicted DNA-binding protein (UPF0251 family)
MFVGTRRDNMQDAKRKGRLLTGDKNPLAMRPELASHGEDHYLAVLDEAEVRRLRSSTERNADAARRLGVSPNTICHVRKRRTWKHVV